MVVLPLASFSLENSCMLTRSSVATLPLDSALSVAARPRPTWCAVTGSRLSHDSVDCIARRDDRPFTEEHLGHDAVERASVGALWLGDVGGDKQLMYRVGPGVG